MHTGSNESRRLVGAFECVFGATIFFGTDTETSRAKMIQRSRFNFMSEAQIWYTRTPDQRVLSSEFENVVVLSDEFYNEVSSHPLPNDLDAVKLLAGSPAVLDVYMWLTYRCFKPTTSEAIPIFGEFGLAGQIGTVEYLRSRLHPRRISLMAEIAYLSTTWGDLVQPC